MHAMPSDVHSNGADLTLPAAPSASPVLVVDASESVAQLLSAGLLAHGVETHWVNTVELATAFLENQEVNLVVTDQNLPDGSGLDLARHLALQERDVDVILMTAFATFDAAVKAIQWNVADYFTKPFDDIDGICNRILRVLTHQATRRKNNQLLLHLQDTMKRLQERTKELESLVVRDSLTRLFNHTHFHERLDEMVAQSARYGHELGLLLVDIDKIKEINDASGHAAGNEVLAAFADVLRGSLGKEVFQLRQHDLAARFGGDEFAIVLPETSRAGLSAKAELLRRCVHERGLAEGLPRVSLSIGTSSFPQDATTRDELVACATTALAAAKRGGRNCVVPFSTALAEAGASAPTEAELEQLHRYQALERCIVHHAFDYHFQPIVHAVSGEIFAYEALCRPRLPELKNPLVMIDTAERAGRIIDLGRALRQVVGQGLQELPEDMLLFINVHPQELFDPLLGEGSPLLLEQAHRVVFEITEAQAIRDYQAVSKVLRQLREKGYRVALDDLGAGYSGLNSLALLEPDFVKLDMAILRGIQRDSRSARLIKHILEFAEGEEILVVAEGIETYSERDVVASMGCPLLQGYFFGKPKPNFLTDRFIRPD